MSQELLIYRIEEKPEAYELIGKYHWDEWQTLYKEWGFDGPETITNKWIKCKNNTLPALFVGYIKNNDGTEKFCGTVASVYNDMSGKQTGYYPWLSVLYVVEEYRRQGIATKLINHCKEYFKKQGFKECYLWAEKPQWEAVYTTLGWYTIENVDYACYKNVPIMHINL